MFVFVQLIQEPFSPGFFQEYVFFLIPSSQNMIERIRKFDSWLSRHVKHISYLERDVNNQFLFLSLTPTFLGGLFTLEEVVGENALDHVGLMPLSGFMFFFTLLFEEESEIELVHQVIGPAENEQLVI